MHIKYHDILNRILEPPLWWLDGVPRYDPFSPKLMPISSEIALVRSACSVCGTKFDVGVFSPDWRFQRASIKADITAHDTVWLSDPPAVFFCQGGHATTSTALAVLQFWERDGIRWCRVSALERRLADM